MIPRKSPKNRRVYQKHGLYALKGAIKEANGHGDWLESLGDVGVTLKAWKADLVADLGGEEAVSTQERAVVDMAVRTHLMLESVDRWLLQQPSLVNKSRRQLFPVVLQRQQLADALARYMKDLGLQRRARPVPSLQGYIEGKYSTDLPEDGRSPLPGDTPRQGAEETGGAARTVPQPYGRVNAKKH